MDTYWYATCSFAWGCAAAAEGATWTGSEEPSGQVWRVGDDQPGRSLRHHGRRHPQAQRQGQGERRRTASREGGEGGARRGDRGNGRRKAGHRSARARAQEPRGGFDPVAVRVRTG